MNAWIAPVKDGFGSLEHFRLEDIAKAAVGGGRVIVDRKGRNEANCRPDLHARPELVECAEFKIFDGEEFARCVDLGMKEASRLVVVFLVQRVVCCVDTL